MGHWAKKVCIFVKDAFFLTRGTFRGKFSFRKSNTSQYYLLALSKKFSDFQRKLFGKVVNTALDVSRWEFRGKSFFLRSLMFHHFRALNSSSLKILQWFQNGMLRVREKSLLNFSVEVFNFFKILRIEANSFQSFGENIWQVCWHWE